MLSDSESILLFVTAIGALICIGWMAGRDSKSDGESKMTRDEAIEASVRCRSGDANRTPNQVKALYINAGRRIDSYVVLGMIKLDEPKRPLSIFCDEIGWPEGGASYQAMFAALDSAGLKLVEK